MTSRSNGRTSEDDALKGALGAVGLVFFMALLKYAVPVFTGLITGLLIYAGVRGSRGLYRVRMHALGLLFFGITLFVVFGLPVDLAPKGPRFPGVIFYWDGFASTLWDAIRWWNGGLPQILHGLRIDPKKVSALSVSQYFWLAMPAAAASSVMSDVFRHLKRGRGKASHGEEEAARVPVLSWPAQAVYTLYVFAFRAWVLQGRDDCVDPERGGSRGLGRAAFGTVLFLGIGAALSSFLIEKIPYYEMKTALTVLAFSPGIGTGVGLLLGFVQWVMGGFGFSMTRKEHKTEGFELGRDARGKPYWLTSQNLSYHVEIVASSGAGKTNLIKNLLLDRIRRGHGVVFLDLKADFDVVKWLVGVASWAGREEDLRLVSLADPEILVPYNPIAGGDFWTPQAGARRAHGEGG